MNRANCIECGAEGVPADHFTDEGECRTFLAESVWCTACEARPGKPCQDVDPQGRSWPLNGADYHDSRAIDAANALRGIKAARQGGAL